MSSSGCFISFGGISPGPQNRAPRNRPAKKTKEHRANDQCATEHGVGGNNIRIVGICENIRVCVFYDFVSETDLCVLCVGRL